MRRIRPALNAAAVRAFCLVLLASFLLDVTAFIGTIFLVQRSHWTLAFLASSTAIWAVCVPLMRDRRNIAPMILGAVLGGWAAISWPT